MKLKKIELKNFYQFKDFTLDLTYPKGHPKEGQALEKVCFIGQSGTGKTTLLKLIRYSLNDLFSKSNNSFDFPNQTCKIELKYEYENGNFNYHPIIENAQRISGAYKTSHQIPNVQDEKNLQSFLGNARMGKRIQYFYYPAEMLYNSSMANYNTESSILIDFDEIYGATALQFIINKIKIYREQYLDFLLKLDNRIQKDNTIDYNQERKKWSEENENPVDDLAQNCLDKLLNKFHLKTKREFDEINKIDLQIINLATNQEIPFQNLSTGTKQMICTSIPLYMKIPDEAIILFDEPERSLFPDLQQMLIKYYTGFAPTCQFFFATHSPIIASQFDSAERIILQFDDAGNIFAERGHAPEGDDPNDLLTKDFMMKNLLGDKAYQDFQRYIEIKTLMRFEDNSDQKEKLAAEFLELGMKYNF